MNFHKNANLTLKCVKRQAFLTYEMLKTDIQNFAKITGNLRKLKEGQMVLKNCNKSLELYHLIF